MSEGTFCHPHTLEDVATRPRPETPVLPEPPILHPPVPPFLGDTAPHDKTHAGSLPTAQSQLDKLQADLIALANQKIAGDAASLAAATQALLQATGDGITQGIDQLKSWLAPIQAALAARIADAQYGSYAATTDYTSIVKPSVEVLNVLLQRQLTLSTLESTLNTLGSMGLDIGTKYFGMSAEQAKAVVGFKTDHLDPMLSTVGAMYSYLDHGVDLGQAPADFLQAMADHLGPDIPFAVGCRQLLAAGQSIVAGLDTLSEMLQLSTEYLKAAQTALMAACQLLAAAKAFIAHAQDVFLNLPFLLASLIANLIPHGTFTFKIPRPVGTLLLSVDGLRNVLAGFSDVGKCFNTLTGGTNPDGKNELDPSSSADAIQGFLTSMAASITASLVGGFAKLLHLNLNFAIPNPLDALRALWEVKPGLNDIQAPRLIILPEESALLAFLTGFGAIAGFVGGMVGSLFGHGTSAVLPENLYQPGLDAQGKPTNTPMTPHPGQSAANMFAACGESLCQARRGDQVAKALQAAGNATRHLAFDPGEDAGRGALSDLVGALSATIAGCNLALDENLANLSPAAEDFHACAAADARHDPTNPPAPPTQADLTQQFINIGVSHAGLPNSPLNILAGHNPVTPGTVPPAPETLVASLPIGGFAPATFDSTYAARLVPTVANAPVFPLMLLLHNESEFARLQALLTLARTLDTIRADARLLAAHQRLLAKAVQQGVAANSPYVWLAAGLTQVSTGVSLLDFIQQFLRHDRDTQILPLAFWLESGAHLDYSVPFVTGLDADENAAANISSDFANTYAGQAGAIEATLLLLRLRADETGLALGYEYAVIVTILSLLNEVQAALANPATTPDDIVALGSAALALAPLVTHQALFTPALKALAGG